MSTVFVLLSSVVSPPPTETVERDLIGAWPLASIEVCPLAGCPQRLGGDADDRDRTGRTQAIGDCSRGRRGGTAAGGEGGQGRQRRAARVGGGARCEAVMGR